jgi:hypothetical protein
MHSQYTKTWKHCSPTDFVVGDFSAFKAKKNTSKTVIELIVSFILFVGFAFFLGTIDKNFTNKPVEKENYGVNVWQAREVDDKIYEYFNEGYIGLNNNYEVIIKLNIQENYETLNQYENLI